MREKIYFVCMYYGLCMYYGVYCVINKGERRGEREKWGEKNMGRSLSLWISFCPNKSRFRQRLIDKISLCPKVTLLLV